jgi:hypothetical protein
MKDENLIHIRLDHSEAVHSKVDVLSTQMNLIKMLKIMKAFHKLRSEELKTKGKIQKKLKDLDANVHKLEVLLPKIHIPKILQHGTEEIKKEVKEKIQRKPDPHEIDLENQLREIQEKLRRLE